MQNSNAWDIISKYDIVLDGSDNFATRYLLNDACVLLDKPLVYGAVLKFEGQVGVFNVKDEKTGTRVNYRDLFPVPPKDALSCNDVGVLGVLPGLMGTMMATEVIKLITGIGTPLLNQVITYNALNNSFYTFEIPKQKDADSQMPLSKDEFLNFNYEWFCNPVIEDEELNVAQMEALCRNSKVWLVDVREMDETPVIYRDDCVKMPLSTFEESMNTLPLDYQIVFICKTGKRSMAALHLLKKQFPDCMAYSLKGGLDAWPQAVTK
jgi:adenylyltransferase/sulfurtransferase